ncbi:MAG: hypothetical protein AAGA62_19225 [Bacteroidota bacterium]
MPFRILSLMLLLLLSSCGGKNFNEASIPPDQLSVELAFKRLSKHGGLEPVIEVDQKFSNWQFYVSSQQKSSVLGTDTVVSFWLKDRAGIAYKVSSESTAAAVIESLAIGTYGFGTGTIISLERDLVAAEIEAVLRLEEWVERKD